MPFLETLYSEELEPLHRSSKISSKIVKLASSAQVWYPDIPIGNEQLPAGDGLRKLTSGTMNLVPRRFLSTFVCQALL